MHHPKRGLGSTCLRAVPPLIGFGVIIALIVTLRGKHAAHDGPLPTGRTPAIYEDLWRDAIKAARQFPKADYVRGNCYQDESGQWRPNNFDDGNGPLGLVYLFRPEDRPILEGALRVFGEFVEELEMGMSRESLAIFRQFVYWAQQSSWHIVVSIFQEHPSLISEEEAEGWIEVKPHQVAKLSRSLEEELGGRPAPKVTVHGLRVCADGAMVVLFDESGSPGGAAVTQLRQAATAVGMKELGSLTTRPKRLIHATVGRVLGVPEGLTGGERAHVEKVVRKWAAALGHGDLPPRVVGLAGARGSRRATKRLGPVRPVPGVGRGVWLKDMTVYRERTWFMDRYKVEHRFPLKG